MTFSFSATVSRFFRSRRVVGPNKALPDHGKPRQVLQAGPFAWTCGNHWPLPFHEELASNVKQNFAGIRKSHPKVYAVFVGSP